MNSYIMSVVAAADTLGFVGSESQLVHQMLQNMHPRFRSHLLFASKPESVHELFALATTVAEAEAVAVEEQRKLQLATTSQISVSCQALKGKSAAKPFVAVADRKFGCWGCGKRGRLQRNCVRGLPQDKNSEQSGNDSGARQ
jgi:hypothetical protein